MPLLLERLMTAQNTHHTQAAPVQPSVAVRHHDCRKMAFMLQLQIKQSRLENVIELKIIWKTIGCFPSHDTGWRHDTGTVWCDPPSPNCRAHQQAISVRLTAETNCISDTLQLRNCLNTECDATRVPDSSASIVTRLRPGGCGARIPAAARQPFLQSIQTGPGAQPPS